MQVGFFFIWSLFFFITEANLRWDLLIWIQPIEFEIEFEHSFRNSFLIDNTFTELVFYSISVRFKTFSSKRVSLESILYFSAGLLLDSFLIDNIFVELIFYNAPIRFKIFLNKGVLLESIFCFSTGLFFVFPKYFWNLDKRFRRNWRFVVNSSLLSLKSGRWDRPFTRFLALLLV